VTIKRYLLVLITVLFLAAILPVVALAAWSNNPVENNPICIAPDSQTLPNLIPDGSGGNAFL